MNFALPAIIFFLVLLPGFVVRSRLKRVERTVIDSSPFGHAVTEGVLWAAALHVVWIGLTQLTTTWAFDPETFLALFATSAELQGPALKKVALHATPVTTYFISLLFVSFLLATAFRKLVTRFNLDGYDHPLSRVLQFSGAPWYYLLSEASFRKAERPDLILISAVVEIGGEAFLYVGILEEFFVNQEGTLDRLILSEVSRRPIERDRADAANAASSFYPIEGDYFVLRYEETKTLNIQYVKLEPPQAHDAG